MSVTPNLPTTSTCSPWAQPSDITEGDITAFNAATVLVALQAASDLLFALSGRQFPGSCADTVRPNTRRVLTDHGRPITQASSGLYGGTYYAGGYGGGSYGYSRFGWSLTNSEELPGGLVIPSIDLGVFPLTAIQQVLVDGVVIDPATYRIDDNRHLVRLSTPAGAGYPANTQGWPGSQNLTLPSTEVGTWQVTFDYGIPPGPLGVMACAEMAYQLLLASNPATAGKCKLPSRVTQITRQGLTAVVLDPMTFLDKGRTGLTLCDYWLEFSNPAGLKRRATMWSPDLGGRRVRRTGGT